MELTMYKLPEKISLAKWMRRKFYIPLRAKLKRQYLVDTLIFPSSEKIVAKLESVERKLIKAKLESKTELIRNYEGQKEILRWIATYGER